MTSSVNNSAHTGWTPDRRTIPAKTRNRIFARDNHTCQACNGGKCDNENLQLDHITPIAWGGGNSPENLQTLGATCHQTKTRNEQAEGRKQYYKNLKLKGRLPKQQHPGFKP